MGLSRFLHGFYVLRTKLADISGPKQRDRLCSSQSLGFATPCNDSPCLDFSRLAWKCLSCVFCGYFTRVVSWLTAQPPNLENKGIIIGVVSQSLTRSAQVTLPDSSQHTGVSLGVLDTHMCGITDKMSLYALKTNCNEVIFHISFTERLSLRIASNTNNGP